MKLLEADWPGHLEAYSKLLTFNKKLFIDFFFLFLFLPYLILLKKRSKIQIMATITCGGTNILRPSSVPVGIPSGYGRSGCVHRDRRDVAPRG